MKKLKFDSIVFYNETFGHATLFGSTPTISVKGIFASLGLPTDGLLVEPLKYDF